MASGVFACHLQRFVAVNAACGNAHLRQLTVDGSWVMGSSSMTRTYESSLIVARRAAGPRTFRNFDGARRSGGVAAVHELRADTSWLLTVTSKGFPSRF